MNRNQIEAHLELHSWRPTGWGVWHPNYGIFTQEFKGGVPIGIQQRLTDKVTFEAEWSSMWDSVLFDLYEHLVATGYIGALS